MQTLTSTLDINASIIDEQYRPELQEDKKMLQELVEQEMRAEGLDPLNKDDVKKYWTSRGIE